VLEALSLPLELFYSDDLVLIADTEELLVEKINKWKAGVDEKEVRVIMGNTKVMNGVYEHSRSD